jgi:DNA-binding MarR family transcriptional regulator
LTAPFVCPIETRMPRREGANAAHMIASECLAIRIRRLDRSLSRIYDAALRPHGLTIAQLGLLTALTVRGPIQPSKLGDILDLERSTVSRNVARMLRKGWVSATPAKNGRTQLLAVTRQGEELLSGAIPAWRRGQKKAIELLTREGALGFLEITRAFATL